MLLPFDEETSRTIMDNLANFFIYPEIQRRKKLGQIDDSFDLIAAQLIQFPDGRERIIRLNSEVKAKMKVKYKNGVSKKPDDPVFSNEIEDVERIDLTDKDDPNCSHITFLKIGGSWFVHFDFRLNKELSKKNIESAKQFLESAKISLEKKHWAPFLDTLFSAAELSIKSILLPIADSQFSKKTTHPVIKKRYNAFADLGNVEPIQKDTFNELIGLRARARYAEPDFSIPEEKAQNLLKTVEDMIKDASHRIK